MRQALYQDAILHIYLKAAWNLVIRKAKGERKCSYLPRQKEKLWNGDEAMNRPSGLKANRPLLFLPAAKTAESDHQMQDMYRLNKTAWIDFTQIWHSPDHGEKSANIPSVSDTAGRICNTVSRLLIADEFDNPEKTSCKVVRVGLLLFGYSYMM